jgi:antitoxin Phd
LDIRPEGITSMPIKCLSPVKVWPPQDAEARFSELLEACLRDGPQFVSRHGAEVGVLVSVNNWRQLHRFARQL